MSTNGSTVAEPWHLAQWISSEVGTVARVWAMTLPPLFTVTSITWYGFQTLASLTGVTGMPLTWKWSPLTTMAPDSPL